MTIVLGIDTGGTYTDGVILERETKSIITSAKSLTTHENLIEGIRGVIQKLDYDHLDTIDYVALSTTLATNAIVENNGCRVGLLLLGYEPNGELPLCDLHKIAGEITVSGKEQTPLDEDAVKAAAEEMKENVDAVAISGIFSIRNPEHENRAAALVKEILDLPIIMAHDLTGTLGVQERTNTAVLNAKLISVIAELMNAVKEAMNERNINAPLMIVKGDGSLMNERIALERPIETILSGPAASIIGATYLNDIDDGLVADMGGTTTDVAVLSNGKPLLTKEGADVGGWRTRVSAVNAYTFGLGGDSYYFREYETGTWSVGPRRSRPVSMVSLEYPYYKQELFRRHGRPVGLLRFGQADGLILLHEPSKKMELTTNQWKIIEGLQDGPHTIVTLGKKIGVDPNFFMVDRLIELGVLGLVGFTPSDVLCAKGIYPVGDREAAEVAAALISTDCGFSPEELYEHCIKLVEDKMCRSLLTCMLDKNGVSLDDGNEVSGFYYDVAVGRKKGEFFNVFFKMDLPIIGIGAPIHAWLPASGRKFGVEPLISAHHEVANAVGAAAGKVMTIFSLLVQNHYGEYLTIFSPWGQRIVNRREEDDPDNIQPFDELVEEVVASAIEEGKQHLTETMAVQQVEDYQVLVERNDSRVANVYNDSIKLFIESKIDVIAVGLPKWDQ